MIHRLSIRLLIAQTRLLLNRAAFTQALTDNSSDPSYGRFGDSFVALFESAQDIVHLVKQLVIYHPSLIARWWFFWFHAFSASVCLYVQPLTANFRVETSLEPPSPFVLPCLLSHHQLYPACQQSATSPMRLEKDVVQRKAFLFCGDSAIEPLTRSDRLPGSSDLDLKM